MECGATCLRMIAKFHGKEYSAATMQNLCVVTREGVSMLGISDAAEYIGFRTICGRMTLGKMVEQRPFPCILHWNQDHFVVLYDVKKKQDGKSVFYIADPGKNLLRIDEEEFRNAWISTRSRGEEKGILMALQPTPAFYKRKDERHTGRDPFHFLWGYMKPYKRFFIQLLLGLALGSVLQLIFPFLTQAIVDKGIATKNLNLIYLILAGQLMLVLSRASVDFIRRWILLHISARVNISLLSDFLIKLMRLPMYKKISKLNTKTKETISNMTYPFWHPSGRYITTSVNDIKQFFHSVKEKKMEVFDLESDVVVYDVKNKEILSKASLLTKDAFETFPAFSPDGKWLYFCTAPVQKMPENYDKVRYNLCRVAFDPDRGEISHPIDTLVRADSLSYTFPRISPDGRFLMYTETAYGQFPIWHPDAEIRMMDLENRTAVDMSALNSPDTDSYHSWSSNSDWVVFSSRRDNGLYTLPYICYIGKDGKPSKPFLLPQEDPDKYDYQLYSYNIPELTKGAVEVSPYEIQQVAEKNKPEQVRFK